MQSRISSAALTPATNIGERPVAKKQKPTIRGLQREIRLMGQALNQQAALRTAVNVELQRQKERVLEATFLIIRAREQKAMLMGYIDRIRELDRPLFRVGPAEDDAPKVVIPTLPLSRDEIAAMDEPRFSRLLNDLSQDQIDKLLGKFDDD